MTFVRAFPFPPLPGNNSQTCTLTHTPSPPKPNVAEVMEQLHGYDYKADLWSLGITALELAKGYAPYAKYPPMKVLILTIQDDPPSLDTYESDDADYNNIGRNTIEDELDDANKLKANDGDDIDDNDQQEQRRQRDKGQQHNVQQPVVAVEQWSPNFRQLVSWLLQKNPAQRPTCDELLQSSLLSTAVSQDSLESQICSIVPDVGGDHQQGPDNQQQQQRHNDNHNQLPHDYDNHHDNGDGTLLGSRRHDAVWGTTKCGRMVQPHEYQHGAGTTATLHQDHDRAPGTTWIFADGSQVLAAGSSNSNMNNSHNNADTASSFAEGEERETDNLLSELDRFCGATGGENYRKEAATTTATAAAPSSDLATSADPPHSPETNIAATAKSGGTMEDLMEEFEFRMEAAKAEDVDDLDQFLDEFEKTTAGENFQRR